MLAILSKPGESTRDIHISFVEPEVFLGIPKERTWSDVVSNFPTIFQLLYKHSQNQHPPVIVYNQQCDEQRVENIVLKWYIELRKVQIIDDFIAANHTPKVIIFRTEHSNKR